MCVCVTQLFGIDPSSQTERGKKKKRTGQRSRNVLPLSGSLPLLCVRGVSCRPAAAAGGMFVVDCLQAPSQTQFFCEAPC